MSKQLVGKPTRDEFREVLTTFVLRDIVSIFETSGLTPNKSYDPPFGGARRALVEQYYANIDFASPSDVRKVLVAFDELIFRLTRDSNRDMVARQRAAGLVQRMERDGFSIESGHFDSSSLTAHVLETPSIIALTAQSIAEHIEKARTKIADKDCAGAITNAYTLVEEFLKEILRQTGTSFKENEGDIRSLYNSVSDMLNLNPKGENLEGHLRTILQGLKSIIAGLYDVANKASDRHARKYNPAEHHAKLAVNAALAVCEFILDSYEYQQQARARKAKE